MADDGYATVRELMADRVYRWKLDALKSHIQNLKTNFPITNDVLEHLKEWINAKFANASRYLKKGSFKVSLLAWSILLMYS